MTANNGVLVTTVKHALSGAGAHAGSLETFEMLDWKLAGTLPAGAPHSLFQLLNHIIYWQNWAVKWLDGKRPPLPEHASESWPGKARPSGKKEWESAVREFRKGLETLDRRCGEMDLLAKHGEKSRLEMFHAIASHNSHHLGQAVLLRQMLGAWPPPSGGLTW